MRRKALVGILLVCLMIGTILISISVCVAEESTSLSTTPFMHAELKDLRYDEVYGTGMVEGGSEVSIKVVLTNVSKEIDESTFSYHSELKGAIGSISGEGLKEKVLQSGSSYTLKHKQVVDEVVISWSGEAPEVGKRAAFTLLNVTQETTEGEYSVVDIKIDVTSQTIEDAIIAVNNAKEEIAKANEAVDNAEDAGLNVAGAKDSLDLANEYLNNSQQYYNEGMPEEALEEAELALKSAQEVEEKAESALKSSPLPVTATPTPPPVPPISPEYLYIIPIALFLILLPFIFYIRRKRKKAATTPEMPSPSPEQKEIGRHKVKQEALINLDYHLKRVNEDVRKVFLEVREKILRLGDVEERIKESEVSYNIKNRIIFVDFFGFHRDHIWMYLKLNKDVEDLRRETEYDEKGFGIGFKRRLKLTKDTDTDYTLELVKQAIKKTTARDIEKKEAPITIERAIYDPCKRDFIEGQLPRMKEWINRYDPGTYWLALSIQNNTERAIDEWGVELETSSALKVEEARVEGIDYKIELRETHPEPYKNKYAIGVPKEYGIVIPKGGAQRVYFKLRAEKPKTTYEITGVFKSEMTGEVPIRAKEFKYLCDTGVSPEAVKAELKKTFSEKEAARLANTFRIAQDIRSSYCNTDTKAKEINKEFDLLKMYLTEKEFLDEIESIQRRINAELREDERLDEKHVEAVKDFCEKFTEMWIAKFLR
jgi:hypothetical protein